MALEPGTYINDLDPANPVHTTDTVSQGDDHLRLIKSTIVATWPNVTGAVTPTHTEMNFLDGVTGTTGSGNMVLSAAPTLTGTVTAGAFSGSIAATNIDSGTLPDDRIAVTGVTQHEASLTVTESQVSDLGTYLSSGDVATTLSIGNADTTLSRDSAGKLAVEGRPVFCHDAAGITSARVFLSDGVEPTTEGDSGDLYLVY